MSQQAKSPQSGQIVARPKQAGQLIGASVATVYRLEAADPTFPRRIKFGPRYSGYRIDELQRWLDERTAESRGAK